MENNMTKKLITLLLILFMTFAQAQTDGDTDSDNSSTDSNGNTSTNGFDGKGNDQVVEEITIVTEDLNRMLVARLFDFYFKTTNEAGDF